LRVSNGVITVVDVSAQVDGIASTSTANVLRFHSP